MQNQRNYIYTAIQDIQATIRAIDLKIGILFLVIFYPVLSLRLVYDTASLLLASNNLIYLFLCVMTLVIWLLSLYTLFNSLSSISNPKDMIKGGFSDSKFHNGDLYDLGLIDVFFNFPAKSKVDFNRLVQDYPSEEKDLNRELIFEQAKLIYIREIKVMRSSACIKLTFLWLILGLTGWSLAYFKIGF